MPPDLITRKWPDKHAIFLVHGVGDAKPGDYDKLIDDVKTLLGTDADKFAIYLPYYDELNDWVNDKLQLGQGLKKITAKLGPKFDFIPDGDKLADILGDVIWPLMSLSSRYMIKDFLLKQLAQITFDGITAKVPLKFQNVTIICHSLGCFHVYELLHRIALNPHHGLTPNTHAFQFKNVILMASPVQLLRTVGRSLGNLVPPGLATLDIRGLYCPSETKYGKTKFSTKRWVSIAGNMDPVGGHFLGNKLNWAYMDVQDPDLFPGQDSYIDPQTLIDVKGLQKLLGGSSIQSAGSPIENPHSWYGYVNRHAQQIKGWLS